MQNQHATIEADECQPVRLFAHEANGGGVICDLPYDWADGKSEEEQQLFLWLMGFWAAQQPNWN